METFKRTNNCGEINLDFVDKVVTLNGWVFKNRNLGGVQFVTLRDRYGVVQLVFNPDSKKELLEKATSLKFEYCIAVVGKVRRRPEDMVNKKMKSGEIEIVVQELEILNSCETLPFMIEEETNSNEDLRLKYRFLDLRSGGLQKRIELRHKVCFATREFLNSNNFFEIETPTFIKSTPEGARDFLVPSRLHKGMFYALPQSPQLYKQLLMVSGFDKYFQIARCYRDEGARGDRQPEFTQIDIEMSFVSAEDIFSLTENLMKHIFKTTMDYDLKTPFKRLPYNDAINFYGSDKPELRIDFKMQDFNSFAEKSEFSVFNDTIKCGGTVKLLIVPNCADKFSRKHISDLEETAKIYGAKGLAWMKATENGFEGGVSKFFESHKDEIKTAFNIKENDLLLFVADSWKISCTALGAVRLKVAKELNLINKDEFNFCWIVDFPLFEWNDEEKKWDPAHHMFTMPQKKYLATMEKNPAEVVGDLYDLVCNGYELASGSIRIHDPEIQKRIFSIVGFSEKEAEEKFGFLLNAFKYGAPPHGGIAPGLDRLIMILTNQESIKEVIAFPKNNVMASPMDDSPSSVSQEQLDELGIKIEEK